MISNYYAYKKGQVVLGEIHYLVWYKTYFYIYGNINQSCAFSEEQR